MRAKGGYRRLSFTLAINHKRHLERSPESRAKVNTSTRELQPHADLPTGKVSDIYQWSGILYPATNTATNAMGI